jgi:uncharacterized protein
MRLLLAGASGLIGTELAQSCRAAGDDVRTLVRRTPASAAEVQWQPESGELDPTVLDGVDAVVCLSGAGVGDHRWTPEFRHVILQSRTRPVGTLARAIAQSAESGRPIPTFISASAVGYYGDTGTERIDESAANGRGFLAGVCKAWEAAAAPAESVGTRVVRLRTGIVLARRGPVLARMVPLFRLGLGGHLGNGHQYWPWIALADEVAAIRFALANDQLSGPVNLTAPEPITNAEFTHALAHLLHRPGILGVPGFALRAVLGEFADEILRSQRVLPAQLTAAGFQFSYPRLEAALSAELGS